MITTLLFENMDDWKLKVRTVVKPRECYFPSAWTDS